MESDSIGLQEDEKMSVLNTMIQERMAYPAIYKAKIRQRRIVNAFNYAIFIAAGIVIYTHYSVILEFAQEFLKTLK